MRRASKRINFDYNCSYMFWKSHSGKCRLNAGGMHLHVCAFKGGSYRIGPCPLRTIIKRGAVYQVLNTKYSTLSIYTSFIGCYMYDLSWEGHDNMQEPAYGLPPSFYLISSSI